MSKKYKILMATMGLGIGGAETHIVELAKGLKENGHEVVVVSNGGVYTQSLTDAGIKHYRIPLHNKKPWNVLTSYRLLKKVIIDENVDIVHAHARIPAFLCSIIHKKVPFKFITTVHWTFKTSFGYKQFTRWGDYSLAVSQDLKDYLVDNYHYPSSHVLLTVNGIDTKAFKSHKKGTGHSGYRLCFVGRIEESTTAPVFATMKGIDRILEKDPNFQLYVIGKGSLDSVIKKEADAINNRVKKEVIKILGPQTKIASLIDECDGFVGVSRAALEAMSMEKPTILAGNGGYLGIFREGMLERAKSNNFTCRGDGPFDDETYIQEVLNIMDLTPEEIKEVGEYGRQVVKEHYSIGKMVGDAEAIYAMSMGKKNPINSLIFGYIGFGNNGDDAIFSILKKFLDKSGHPMTYRVLTNDTNKFINEDNVESIYSFSPMKILSAIHKSQVVIANGGTLLQDETSTRSLLYYLAILKTASLLKKKVIIFANGVGPIDKKLNRSLVKKALNKTNLITLRDQASKDLLKDLGVTKPPIYVTADVVFTLKGNDKTQSEALLKKEDIPITEPLVAVAIRPWFTDDKMIPAIAKVCDRLSEAGYKMLFVPLQDTKKISDTQISKKVTKLMNHSSYILKNNYNAEELIGILGLTQGLIGMRFHSIVFTLLNHLPVYGLSYDIKVENYLKIFNLPYENDLANIDDEEVFQDMMNMLRNKKTIGESIDHEIATIIEGAQKNEDYLVKYLNRWF